MNAWQIASSYGSGIVVRRWLGAWIDLAALMGVLVGADYLLGNDLYQRTLPVWIGYLLLYFPILEGKWGWSVGKLLTGTRVVDEAGLAPGIWKATKRTIPRLIEVNPLLLGGIPAGIAVLVSDAKQRLGDMWAGTYVLRAKDLRKITFRGIQPDTLRDAGTEPCCEVGEARYSPVQYNKLVILSLLTFGLYELLWLYRMWRYVQRAEGSAIWPWARALFAPIWYYPLLKRLNVRGPIGLTVAFWFLGALYRLPGPYWLLAFLSFLPLLPALRAANELNRGSEALTPSFAWRKRSVAILVLGLVAVPLAVIGDVGPPGAVVAGDQMRSTDVRFLTEAGLLMEGEEVLYFYSRGLLSARSVGAFASNFGITSYWTDPVSEQLSVAFLRYEQIQDVEVNYSSDRLSDTAVRIYGPGGTSFIFFLSPEAGGDRLFMEEVERRRQMVPRKRITA